MKVLLDACTARPLRQFLPGHFVRTVQEMGWGGLTGDFVELDWSNT